MLLFPCSLKPLGEGPIFPEIEQSSEQRFVLFGNNPTQFIKLKYLLDQIMPRMSKREKAKMIEQWKEYLYYAYV